jgi:CrcB protein
MGIKILNLVIGGTTGTIARYALGGVVHRLFGTEFPYGTMAVNVLGCFIIGFLVSISENKFLIDPNARMLLMVGFCGAFTTFSSLILDTNTLIKDGETLNAFLNVLLSVVIGFLVFRVGVLLGEAI